MAATLPAINPMGDTMMSQSPIMQHQKQSRGTKNTVSTYVVSKKRSQGQKERELENRLMALRANQPDLTRIETAEYRHTYKHNLCLEVLQAGFHRSFAELFALIKQQNEEREIAGPESVMWTRVLLEDEPEKLEVLKMYLTRAEAAFRQDNFSEVYQCQYQLARYFQSKGDKWLMDHFFENCLVTTTFVQADEGKMAAEGHCNVGLALEENGDYLDATDNFELFYKLCKDKTEWTLEDGEPMHYKACGHLTRIYTTVAMKYESEGEMQMYLNFLEKANEMAFGSGDRKLEGESCYRVGVAYQKNNQSSTALKYLNKYLEICRSLNDDEGYGKACEAIARSYESEGKIAESIKYLEMFVEVAEKTKNDKATSRACSNLGAMFNSLGQYDQAVEYFNKSYNISRAMNDTETISSSRVLFGVAAAHKMLNNFTSHVELRNRPCIERIIEWKDNRGDEFDKPVTSPTPSEQLNPEKDEDEEEEKEAKDEAADEETKPEESQETEKDTQEQD